MPRNAGAGNRGGVRRKSAIAEAWRWCHCGPAMMERHSIEIALVYVPVKRARTLDAAKVDALAEDMLEHGQTTPISVRADTKDGAERFVLIEGLHRLEALKALGETTVTGFLVQARIR